MLETKEVLKKLKISRQTLYNWRDNGKINFPEKSNQDILLWDKNQINQIEKLLIKKKNQESKENRKLSIGNRRYLGSKQKMLDFIWDVVSNNTKGVKVVADIFGGTGVVSDFFMSKKKSVIVNDILYSNYVSYLTWFGNEEVDLEIVQNEINRLNELPSLNGYTTTHFSDKYFSLENTLKIDAIRESIENDYSHFNDREKSMLLTSLMYAMDKVANTVGHFDAYRKTMDSNTVLELKIPEIITSKNNLIYNMDANKLVREIESDLVYIDTPYNSRGYENMYHVLENIIEWKKPDVEGVAKKAINRSEKSSEYTKSKAPVAFDDLISNIKSKYILVSYNNTGVNANSRSNAKISHFEIISTLLKRGKIKTFETKFSPFTTGKTNLEDHKEILYLCEINNEVNYVNTPLNYSGSKYKLLDQIMPLIPNDIKNFYELFAGGAVTSINHFQYNKDKDIKYHINDIDENIINLYERFRVDSYEVLIKRIDSMIKYYGLSNTFYNGYDSYGCSGSEGLAKYNREGYERLKLDYNNSKGRKTIKRSIQFYLLIIFGFNNQIRFNSNNDFNLPVGKRDFNSNMRRKLFEFHSVLNSFTPQLSSKSYSKFNNLSKGDFVYVDPPYLLGMASYNENGAWTKKDDDQLLKYLDDLNDRGVKFALSNVVLHKNLEHEVLIKWASKYTLHVLNYNYNNSNYQTTANTSSTVEVLITNY